jgi:hypothetical protein
MKLLKDIIEANNFSIESIDLTEINKLANYLPKNGVIDINIAEKGLIYTVEGQNLCQEKIAQLERWIGVKESEKNKAWSRAALEKAKDANIKTVKEKEWFAQSDDDYIESYNQLALAKASKKWFENKANYFSTWHYALKTFLRRDYSLEKISGNIGSGYNSFESSSDLMEDEDMCGDIDWK